MSAIQFISLNSSSCHPLLLNLSISNPFLFREPLTESSLQYGLCPETYIAFSLATVVLLLYIATMIIAMIGLVWQRKKTHIQARSLPLIIANMVANLTLVLLVTLRVIVSKKLYPCFLLSLTFMLYPPLLTLPSILRGLRLYSLFKLNLKKKRIFGSKHDESLEMQQLNESRRSIVDESSTSLESMSSQQTNTSCILSISEPQSLPANTFDQISNRNQTIQCSSDEAQKPSNQISTRDRVLMRMFEFLSSYKFFITVYLVSFLIHLGLWAIVGGIEIGVYKSSGSWVFVESGFFEASHGCNITPKILIVLGIQAAFYIALVVIVNILCLVSDRDTFNIKLEELTLTAVFAVIIILYTIFGSIPVITTLVDYFVPYVLIFVVYTWLETVIGVILPVYYSIRDSSISTPNQNNSTSEKDHSLNNTITSLLHDKKAFEIISDFARRSYCLEDVLAWKEIQNFKKMKKRRIAAFEFLKTFLVSGSPLELNIPNGYKTLNSLQESLDSNMEEPPANLFADIEFNCLFNMVDLLQRLKVRNDYIANKLSNITQ
ncbi:predicted protein [Naegleria gruberi]|uniref:Predicted protein n=1 Tax=Naegleria gruberi TaxID=5762 RepID=D2V385_NAEGR|nr:uncharacterized protein NAEGRDRAFT_63266 [Naegleria gruberi]EFC48592.1 predicted protein [Naegleria gruberi]|eukprot:XP_002681336.1 predicted protein [Naegleria gruberi strain NEG-M]